MRVHCPNLTSLFSTFIYWTGTALENAGGQVYTVDHSLLTENFGSWLRPEYSRWNEFIASMSQRCLASRPIQRPCQRLVPYKRRENLTFAGAKAHWLKVKVILHHMLCSGVTLHLILDKPHMDWGRISNLAVIRNHTVIENPGFIQGIAYEVFFF